MKPSAFDARAASSYAEGPPRQVPGYSSLHRMVSLLLAERTPQDGRVLVLGAGGGQELKALAEAHAGWSFEGVDPSPDMLRVAEQVAGPHAARMRFHRGYIDDASDGPFDAIPLGSTKYNVLILRNNLSFETVDIASQTSITPSPLSMPPIDKRGRR